MNQPSQSGTDRRRGPLPLHGNLCTSVLASCGLPAYVEMLVVAAWAAGEQGLLPSKATARRCSALPRGAAIACVSPSWSLAASRAAAWGPA